MATRPISDLEAYRERCNQFVYQSGFVMKPVFTAAGQLLVGTGPAEYAALDPGGPGKVLTGNPDPDSDTPTIWAQARDTGNQVIAAAGTVADHAGLTVSVRRVDNTVVVHLVETSNAAATGAVTLGTLPDGYRIVSPAPPADPATAVAAIAPAYNPAGAGSQVGTVVVFGDGTIRLHSTSGQRHNVAVVGLTVDAWPT